MYMARDEVVPRILKVNIGSVFAEIEIATMYGL